MWDRWYDDGQLWHAHKADGAFWCGLNLLQINEDRLIQATEEDPFPPTPCPACLLETAMRDVEPESIEHAKSRGYEPAPDVEG